MCPIRNGTTYCCKSVTETENALQKFTVLSLCRGRVSTDGSPGPAMCSPVKINALSVKNREFIPEKGLKT